MSSHTKGPWEARAFLVVGGDRMSDRICHVGSSTSLPPSRSNESEANARLISAAPELLEHAQMLAKSLEYQIRKDEMIGDNEGANLKRFTLDLVNETLAKATASLSLDPDREGGV